MADKGKNGSTAAGVKAIRAELAGDKKIQPPPPKGK